VKAKLICIVKPKTTPTVYKLDIMFIVRNKGYGLLDPPRLMEYINLLRSLVIVTTVPMFRFVLAILTAWSCVFAQTLPAAAAKLHCPAPCCAHCASNGCNCATLQTSPQWIGSAEHKTTAVRSLSIAKVISRDPITWSSATASQLAVRGISYCSRRLASTAEAPLFKEHCSLLI